jgi:tRNA A37 methylthiotransferase MiaB
MRSILNANGIKTTEKMEDADVVIVNTCTVKKPTEQKILYLLDRLEYKKIKTVVAGCMASANTDLIKRHAPNASIISTSNIDMITEAVMSAYSGKNFIAESYKKADKLQNFIAGNEIIAKIPVSEGCLSTCTFCETKFARGPLNSFSEELILKAIERSVKNGAKEIQLTSQDMGAYGLDRKTNVAMLMHKISEMDGDFKVRIGMLNPDHMHKYINELI